MPLTDEDRKSIMTCLLKSVSRLENKEYQINAWIKGVGIGTDFDETVCQFFDIADPVLDKYKDFGITEKQQRILAKFRDDFRVFSDKYYHPNEFIDGSDWKNMMAQAKEVLHAFNYNEVA